MGLGTKGMRRNYTAETQGVLSGIPGSGVAPLPKARANWTDPMMRDGKRPESSSTPAAPSAKPAPKPAAPSAKPAAPSAKPAAPSAKPAAPSAKPKAKAKTAPKSDLKAFAGEESNALWASKEREKLAASKKQMAARNNDSALSKAVGFLKRAPTVRGYDSYKKLMG